VKVWVVTDHSEAVAEWTLRRLPEPIDGWGPCRGIGVARGPDLIAGIVYNNLDAVGCQMSIASTSPGWATRPVLRLLFHYPFNQYGLRRVYALTSAKAAHTRAFLERLGFVQEGLLREGFVSGDAAVYGMLKRECRWIGDHRGKEQKQLAAAAA